MCVLFLSRAAETPLAKIEATKIAELRRIAADSNRAIVSAHIEATILWASSVSNRVAVEDESGSALIELDHREQPLKAGQKISVRGLCLAENRRLRFGSSLVVDNDGPHAATEQSGAIFLTAGKHPIRVGYYDGGYNCALTVEYEGPGIPRQIVPEKALYRSALGRDGGLHLERGVNYRCFVGTWSAVPDFSTLTPTKIGVATNFDFNVRERGTNAAILYTGWIDAPHGGLYTFYTTSDDGSLLWIGDPTVSMNVLGDGPAPSATTLNVATLKIGDAAFATVEGIVSFARVGAGGQLELRIESGTNQISAVVETGAPFAPVFSHVRARGVAHRLRSTPSEPTWVEVLIASGADFEILNKPAQKNSPLAKNIADLRRVGAALTARTVPARLDGTILAANADGSTVIFQDETAITLLELDPREQNETPGRRIRIDGPVTVARNRLSARAAALIDNDGVHAKEEKSASVYLRKGRHPFEVAWFNMLGGSALEVSYEGPGLARRPIESSVLSHAAFNPGKRALEFQPGLEVGVHEGVFSSAAQIFNFNPIKTGIWETISLAAATRSEKVALDFRGFIDIPRDGHYVFHLTSDDGSLLYVNQASPIVEFVGTAVVPAPREIAPRQWAPNEEQGFWASVEGVVSYIDAQEKSTELELASSSGRIHIEVAEPLDVRPAAFMNCRVRVTGICETALTLDGQRIAGLLRTPSFRQVEIIQATPRIWADHRVTPIRELLKNVAESDDDLARITAKVYHHGPNASAVAEDESGQIDLDVSRLGNIPDDVWINIIGRRVRKNSKEALVGIASRTIADTEDLDALRLLTTIDEIKSLSRLEASRGYPVKARGVVTAIMPEGFFLQDSTRSIYVEYHTETGEEKPERGDCWEVEGTTFAMFAPNIRAKRAVRLGKGTLPEPLRPSWDQLISGSLDTHYIEIEGVIVSADDQNVLLLTRAGKLTVQPWGIDPGALKRAENGRVRLRGCYAPDRDEETQQVRFGQIFLYDASMSVDEPAPADPFSAPLKHASDLLRFDAQGGALQRVKVIGQILHQRDGEYFVY
ncbi:MAG TPA: PA14 domain-containing protein, partial [Verrucomicrobiae bacterium]